MHGGVPSAYDPADRVGFRQRLRDMGAGDKPLWLTEVNAMPYDDTLPGWAPGAKDDGFRITQDEQANYVLQAYALTLSAGWDKVFFLALSDDPYPVPDELWGLVRFHDDRQNGDVSRARPAFTAYQLATQYMGNADWSRLLIKTRPDPQGRRTYASRYKWAAHAAVFQKGDRRAWVLWNGTDQPQSAAITPWGVDAKVVDKYGTESPLAKDGDGRLTVQLDRASRHFSLFGGDPEGYFYIGGSPLLVVENGVPNDAPAEITGFGVKEPRPDVPGDFDTVA
jgi:hypothetical protein